MKNRQINEDYYSGGTPQSLIDATKEKIHSLLEFHYPEHLDFGDGSYAISHGSTHVMIVVRPFTTEEAAIECISHVVTGAKISENLLRFLMRKNSELHFGAFGLLFDETVTFSHSFTSSVLSDKELITSLDAVALIADHYDDIIVDLAGGKRSKEVIEEE